MVTDFKHCSCLYILLQCRYQNQIDLKESETIRIGDVIDEDLSFREMFIQYVESWDKVCMLCNLYLVPFFD